MRVLVACCLALLCAASFVLCACSSTQPEPEGNTLEKRFPAWKDAVKLSGDKAAGKSYFETKVYDSFMPCIACHSFDAKDSWTEDGDGLVRAGYPIWAAAHRTDIKGSGTNLVTLGGNVCVPFWMGGPKEGMTAQELANLDAFLKAGGGKDHATAKNIDWDKKKHTLPAKVTGGDAARGKPLVIKYCNACHTVEDQQRKYGDVSKKLKPAVVPTDKLDRLAKRIRDQGRTNNEFMPGFSDDRMPEKDLLDILAWFEKRE